MPALISFGDFTLAEVLDPGITFVDHDPRLLATAAFRLLRQRAERPDDGPARIVVPTRLVPRGSGEVAAPGAAAVAVSAMGPSTGSGSITGSADAAIGGALPALVEPAAALVATALTLVHPEPGGDAVVPAAAPIGAP
jgi:LacI family transcriptional regulator